jgi:UDP-4-amino-4,6-dideoxy-L-N-acetyl-beta-L-altrosamine transaminase
MKRIPYGHQDIDAVDIAGVVKTLRSDLITQGPKIKEFEDALRAYAGARYAVAVSSGTAALHIACLAIGIGKGDEVITSPVTFVASANCVFYCNGKPVFADIEEKMANIDAERISGKINKKTMAIIPVHFAGHPCDMQKIGVIAKRHNLKIIEDAAHALGAVYKGKRIGSCAYSDMAIFSFHPVKSITTGEGGAVLTNSKELYKKLLLLRNHGITKDEADLTGYHGPWYYEMQCLGLNYRITDLQAALGISQLKKLDRFIERRRHIASLYDEAFKDNPYFDVLKEHESSRSSYHLYPILLKDRLKGKRRAIFEALRSGGLGVQVHYIPVYLQPFYKQMGFKKGTCPRAEDYYLRTISIPIYPDLSDLQVEKVISVVLCTMRKSDRP